MDSKLCSWCGKRFLLTYRERDKKYCSWACYDSYRKDRHLKEFWKRIDKGGPVPTSAAMLGHCWVWKGVVHRDGYGIFCKGAASVRAHRYSWELHYGSIPSGLLVCHKCDNPACVRPDHLFLGSPLDNERDTVTKGRSYRGEDQWSSKLNDSLVFEMRKRHLTGESYSRIANDVGVSVRVASCAVRGETWKHVPFPDATMTDL